MSSRNNIEAFRQAGAGAPVPPLVWKFGGTSVADHDRLRAVAERMVEAQRSGRGVVAVLSAMGKSTDELVRMAYGMTSRPPLRELDALLSVGESISCSLAAMAVSELGSRAVSLTGRQAGITTDDAHGNARLVGITPQRIHDELAGGSIVLVTGFQGVSADGDVTTLGRGGSDASAVAVAAALGADECEIFTDVPAVFTADPRVVPDARRLSSVRHEEMLEMAEAGAGVLQPRSVELAHAHGVDIHLRSSFSTEPGTWIRREAAGFEPTGSTDVAGVAHRRQESLYAVDGVGAGAVTTALAERGIAIGAVLPAASGRPVHRARRGAGRGDRRAGHHRRSRHGRPGAGVGVGGQPGHRPQAGDPDARHRRAGSGRDRAAADHHDRRPGDRAGGVGAGRRRGAAAARGLRPGGRGARRRGPAGGRRRRLSTCRNNPGRRPERRPHSPASGATGPAQPTPAPTCPRCATAGTSHVRRGLSLPRVGGAPGALGGAHHRSPATALTGS